VAITLELGTFYLVLYLFNSDHFNRSSIIVVIIYVVNVAVYEIHFCIRERTIIPTPRRTRS